MFSYQILPGTVLRPAGLKYQHKKIILNIKNDLYNQFSLSRMPGLTQLFLGMFKTAFDYRSFQPNSDLLLAAVKIDQPGAFWEFPVFENVQSGVLLQLCFGRMYPIQSSAPQRSRVSDLKIFKSLNDLIGKSPLGTSRLRQRISIYELQGYGDSWCIYYIEK